MSSSSSAEAPAPSVSPSPTTLSSPPPVVEDTSSQQIAPTSPPPSLPPASLPTPPQVVASPPTNSEPPLTSPPVPLPATPPPQVVASPPTNSEPPLTSPPVPLPATPTQPVLSPPPPPLATPSLPPPPPPSVIATHPISPPQLPPQPPPPPPPLILTSPPISPSPQEISSPSPPATPLRPTLSLPPPSAPPLLPTTTPPVPPPPKPTLAPPFTRSSGSPPPSALASPPPSPASPQAPKFLTSPPEPPPLVNRILPAKPGNGQFHISAGLAVGCVTGVILLVIMIALALLFVCCQYRRKKNHRPAEDHYKLHCLAPKGALMLKVLPNPCSPPPGMSSSEGSGSENPIPPAWGLSSRTFTYDQLVVATNGFSETNLLGQGGFGYVHKGILPSGQQIAVKQLKKDSGQGEREFQAEIETISRVHHKHLVSLVGYCVTGAERLLVYEFVPNNTLEFHLHGEGRPVLEWAARMRIAVGSAKGIAYLHEDCNPAIIHRDIKASNILLDFRFEAKVSDFGLAKISSDTNASITHISTRVVGTFGYLAPEYASSGKVTYKSDVYSYGVMLLELITGRPPISKTDSSRNEGLVGWARPLLSQALEDGNFDALVDPRLLSNYNTSEMAITVACAAACVRHSAWLRPRMSQIVHALEGHVSLMDLDEGMPPGHGNLYGYSGSSNFDAHKCMEEMKKFNMTLESQEYGISKYSESTSECGLNPSGSSSEFQHNLRSR